MNQLVSKMKFLVCMQYIVNKCYMSQSSVFFNKSHFFKIKVKDRDVFFFAMNHFVYACMGREGRDLRKCTIACSQGGSVKNFDFLRINEWP